MRVNPNAGQLYFRGNDGKMHTYYWTSASGWVHDWIETSWQAPSDHSVHSSGSIAVGDRAVFYKGSHDNKLRQYHYDNSGYGKTSDYLTMDEIEPSPTLPGNISELDADNGIAINRIYPNPVVNDCNIEFVAKSNQVLTIKVYDLLGKEVLSIADSQTYEEGSHTINFNVSTLNKGTYYCNIKSTDGSITVEKIVVQ